MLPMLLTVSPWGIELVNQRGKEGLSDESDVSRDWKFQPPNTLLKQERFQLAEASFCGKLNCPGGANQFFLIQHHPFGVILIWRK